MDNPQELLDFWFSDEIRPRHFRSTPEFDQQLKTRFLAVWEQARRGELDSWLASSEGCLALVILLDQFPLNMFRDQPLGYSTEQHSREVANHAILAGFDTQLPTDQRAFLYLPFMHSESLPDQDYSVMLFEAAGMQESVKWAKHHREIIRQFGRFPHRNAVLGRQSSKEELTYLESDQAFHG
ncbi:MAG: DUF924 domain-containing protein [Candidatus Thiodiazotropha lotti]|uniref:DUF924 domain-containing protein n=1 Tax=Candidatus Thiodiazotropha lotti TaxID=2792787 RepID=A0A9E4K167_9GAMM|nr:DUF924 domain-containing protein [Candidatus Thiodiazotropha lotti]ODB94773.1 hypothetical protein A3197_18715 [Candidatus Thiodiazotropha endoloripes]MCG7922968.1 DUF924 domain-containing protein [Candidatus Thiodiazotropha lotti]MCG7937737.1 DUF924 domain-containing protein [Candidatus Thiodiazotropha lotti]MCG7988747.1 DUF924 domain-containing protein [Candidatus Thiodiazotropha lotti]